MWGSGRPFGRFLLLTWVVSYLFFIFQLSLYLVAMERAGVRRDSPLAPGPPAPGPRAAPLPPWTSRWRSGRVHLQRPSRCVRPGSRHTVRGPGRSTHSSHAGLPHGRQQTADHKETGRQADKTNTPLACLMAEAPLTLPRVAPPRRRGPWPGGLHGHNSLTAGPLGERRAEAKIVIPDPAQRTACGTSLLLKLKYDDYYFYLNTFNSFAPASLKSIFNCK